MLSIHLHRCTLDVLIDERELQKRRDLLQLDETENQTPWQEIYRNTVGQLSGGGIIELAEKYKKIRHVIPRHSH
jgi:dihydroxy-acid dehydratase